MSTERSFLADAELLGISLSDKNHIKSLWDQHCKKISGVTSSPGALDDQSEVLLEDAEDPGIQTANLDMINDILSTIRHEQSGTSGTSRQEQLDWINVKITALSRVKADLELGLRHISMRVDEQPPQPR